MLVGGRGRDEADPVSAEADVACWSGARGRDEADPVSAEADVACWSGAGGGTRPTR